jgi:hypothetical protein
VLLFRVFLGPIVFIGYPPPYFTIDGGWTLLKILINIHLVIGPLLTFIVFKSGKPSLKFDLSCIVLLQLGALIYGGLIIYQQHPAFVVFGIDRFTAIAAADVDFDQLQYPELQRRFGIGPVLAQVRLPDDPKLRQELLFGVLLEGQKDLKFRAELYEPYQPDLAQLRSRSIDLSKIAVRDATAKAVMETFAEQHGGRLEDYFYLPLRGRNKDIVMALSAKDGKPVG